ncbi:MAG: 2-hydroxyacyl-CoA dehydratase [Verrucomicrobia bacterium]|nr:2-hydroxyacyl-CoA dehydratase [Verrucomicrobiota bacterium]
MNSNADRSEIAAEPAAPGGCCGSSSSRQETGLEPLAWFSRMIPHCKEFAQAAKAAGRPIVGIMCEYAPRELILAAGGVPVCLCGGDADTIPAAEAYLPTNLCPLIKSTYGYLVEKSNPFLELADLVLAETTCDGKKKMFELMAERRPTYLMELPQKEDDPDALEQWVREMRKLKEFLERRFQVDITRERLRSAIDLMNRERALRRGLAELMQADHPPLTGRQLLDLKSIVSAIPADLEQYTAALEHFRTRRSPGENGRVRVLLTGVPIVHGAERVLDLIEGQGGLVVCQENCTGLKPILEDVSPNAPDPIRALAEKYYHLPCSVKTPNRRRLELLRELARAYRAECVIELIWQACLTYAIESFQVERVVRQELGLPYLRVETDYSPSDSARIVVRIEALFETVRASRGDRAMAGSGGPAAAMRAPESAPATRASSP